MRQGTSCLARVFGLFLAGLTILAPAARGAPVDVALVLAVDVSSSISDDERLFQRRAYAAALRDPHVLRAALGGRHGRIALAYMEWSGPRHQVVHVPLQTLGSSAEIEDFAARVDALADRTQDEHMGPRQLEASTAIGSALARAGALLDEFQGDADQRVIDISGDGVWNSGQPVDRVRAELLARGVTINGLPIAMEDTAPAYGVPAPGGSVAELEAFYANCIVGGPAAFHIVARGWSDMTGALRAKLVLELAYWQQPDRPGLAEALRGLDVAPERIRPAAFSLSITPQVAPTLVPRIDCARFRTGQPIP